MGSTKEKTIINMRGNFKCEEDIINSIIIVEGSIICEGNIKDSKIICGGDFTCNGYVEGTEIRTKTGELTITNIIPPNEEIDYSELFLDTV